MGGDSKRTARDVRFLKVMQHYSDQPVAYLSLKGRWLERAGFAAGDLVRVCVQHKRLVITAVESKLWEK